MSKDYTVKLGDCVSSIAFEHGFFWRTLWDHPDNQQLKAARQDPNILKEGDHVYVPDLRLKLEPGATQQRHRFRRRGVPEVLKVVIKRLDKPRGNTPYILDVDGQVSKGETDGEGKIEHPVSPSAKLAKLVVGQGSDADTYVFHLGHTDPVTEVSGVQGRLNNLGFACGPADGVMNETTVAALQTFQAKMGLTATGQIDQATRDALVREHGS